MTAFVSRVARELFRKEWIAPRFRWWFVAEGTSQWLRLIQVELAPHLGGQARAVEVLTSVVAPMYRRRYGVLRAALPGLPGPEQEPRAIGLVLGAIARSAANPGTAWVFDGVGGAPRSFAEHARAEALIAPLSVEARWDEVTTHLGELLIALTEGLPAHMDRSRPILGEICFDAGVRYARKIKKAFALQGTVEEAIEVLRMSEYIFKVNPEHWGGAEEIGRNGWLEGTACPWYSAPGWNGAHCGIFGQFQSGIASAFGLKYHLTSTIPKHGGHTCRIDLKPVQIHRGKGGPAIPARGAA